MSDYDYFSREARLARRARRLASFDGIAGVGESKSTKLTTQNAGQYAIRMAREVLDNFRLPTMPKLSYSGIRGAKTAQSSSKLEDGVITIFAEMKTLSNIIVGFDIPMEIRAGELMEPSVILIDGAPRIIAQSSFDDMVFRGTIYEQPPVRELYSAPLTHGTAQELYGNRRKQKTINPGMFSLGAAHQALKDAVAGRVAQVVDPLLPQMIEDALNEAASDDEVEYILEYERSTSPEDMSAENFELYMDVFGEGEHEAQGDSTNPMNVIPINPKTQPLRKRDISQDDTQFDLSRDPQLNSPSDKEPLPLGYMRPGEPLFKPLVPLEKDVKLFNRYDPNKDYNKEPDEGATRRERGPGMPKLKGPVQRGQGYETDPDMMYGPTQISQKPGKAGAVEDYDADDKHEKPEPDRNQQDEDCLDPAERSTNDIHAGQKVTIKQTLEVKNRGGGVTDISKGTSVLVVRDHAGDNKSFVIRLDDGMEVIVERCFLAKSAQMIESPEKGMPTQEDQKDQMDNEPVSLVADMDFMAKVEEEVRSMAGQGITEIDAKSAVFHKYGPEVAAKIFE